MGIRASVALRAGKGRLQRVMELAAAAAFAAVATGIASLPPFKPSSTTSDAALIYLLSVAAAALVAGLPGGLLASLLSFLGLNFFFTPPLRTFAVAKSDDLLALIVFLVVAVLVASLLTKTVAQRTRAERAAREAQLLYAISSRLLGGAPLATALHQFARDLVELFSLAACRVATDGLADVLPGGELQATAGTAPAPARTVVLPLRTDRGSFGEVQVVPGPAGLEEPELGLARAFAGQMALAVEAAVLAERSRRSQAEAETARVRAALFSSVTHDLRTPLAAIKASATSLLDAEVSFDNAQRADLLSTIAEESDRLNRLIANLLSLSRLRAGALVPEKTAAAVEDVIEAVLARLHRRWKGLAIQVRVGDNIPSVPMDLLQIDQVVSNLVENAVNYAGVGEPVEVRVEALPGWVEVWVADRGPGIPAADRERVFEEFYRRDTARGEGGVGLGLAISRAIVEAHGGSIWASETPGGGATVGFRLPAASTVRHPDPAPAPPLTVPE